MNRFDSTLDFINTHTNENGYSAGDTIFFDGYTIGGDRGNAAWKSTGNVIAASQTPLALNDIKMSDADGHEFELVGEGVIDLLALGGAGASYQTIADNAGLIYSLSLNPAAPINDIKYIDTVASLKATTGLQVGFVYQCGERSNAQFEVIAGVGTANSFNIIAHDTENISFRLIDEDTVNIVSWGGLGDWNGTTGTDNQAVIQAAADYLGADGGQIDFPAFPGGQYKLGSALTINEGVVLNGLGTVGSVAQKGVKFVVDHTGDGIIFDGNNGAGSTEGAEQAIINIWILKAPNRNGGIGLQLISTSSSNTPGWGYFENMTISGNSTSSGEGLWSKGIVINGSQATIGLKNLVFKNCGVTGVSTDNSYLEVINGTEITFDNMYIRNASASFPSAGDTGILIDSDQGAVPAANNPSSFIRFNNSLILGAINVGECDKLYFSNSYAVEILPSGVSGDGTNIVWTGGELINKYVDTTGYTTRVDTLSQTSLSDLSNQFRATANLSLDKSYSGIFITHAAAAGNLTHTLPNFISTNIFDFTIMNTGNFNVTINKNAANNFYPKGTTLNANITDVVIPSMSTVRFKSNGINDSAVLIDVIKGITTLTGLGTMTDRGDVARISILAANLLTRPREATKFVLDAGASSRNFSIAITSFDIGDEVDVINNGASNNINFDNDVDATYGEVLTPGTAGKFIFNGATFSRI